MSLDYNTNHKYALEAPEGLAPVIETAFTNDQFEMLFDKIWISPNHQEIVKKIVDNLASSLNVNIERSNI